MARIDAPSCCWDAKTWPMEYFIIQFSMPGPMCVVASLCMTSDLIISFYPAGPFLAHKLNILTTYLIFYF